MTNAGPPLREDCLEVVITSQAVPGCYTYRCEVGAGPREGDLVAVGFGRRHLTGLVTRRPSPAPAQGIRLRTVGRVLIPGLLPTHLLKVCRDLARHYDTPLATVVAGILPASLARGESLARTRTRVVATPAPVRSGSPRQKAILAFLQEAGGSLPIHDLLREARTTRGTVTAGAAAGLWQLVEEEDARLSDPKSPPEERPLELSSEQRQALGAVLGASSDTPLLLHGITGSGKTEVYMQAMAACLAEGRQALMLVPEISLTPQTERRFRRRFGGRVVVLHSGLSDGERQEGWQRAADGRADIVVGARSALFAPLPRPGLIILDEEHDGAYKQEQAPRYHARLAAQRLAAHTGARLVLGSATPALETWHATLEGRCHRVRMPTRIHGLPLPPVTVVDMREETLDGHGGLFSRRLIQALEETLERGEQAIILLNRRGWAPTVLCRTCGTLVRCPTCAIALTHHREAGQLRCHYCGHAESPEKPCSSCGGSCTRSRGAGTEQVTALLERRFEGVPILRLDRDTAAAKDAHDRILGAFGRKEAGILVGTQMVAKGLDFPGVTLVGVLSADAALGLPDFRAAERTFQLVTQVAGRAGRAREGRVVVQALDPDHPAVRHAARHDYEAFANEELALRRMLDYPPFTRLVVVTASSQDETLAEAAARSFRGSLPATEGQVLGPAPAPLARLHGRSRHLILFKTRHLHATTTAIRRTIEAMDHERDIRWTVDVDAMNLL
ncbi:MAG: primosomal protein N' [Candidatus Sericytochromatia bacterium]|nr:primosomal protein N' [Candidatus Sericytochromatia bacterium]